MVVYTFVLLSVLIITGCASSGTPIRAYDVGSIEKGVTTESDIRLRFGPPQTVALDQDGNRIYGYTYVKASSRPESFIPIVGPFVGGVDMQTQVLQIRIDKDGLVQDFVYTDAPSSVNMGLRAR